MTSKITEEIRDLKEGPSLPADLAEVVEYHTHLCGGLLIGYRAVKYAIDLLGESNNMLVVANKSSCGDDAIRVLLDCTEENGNLLFQKGEGMAWSFYNKEEEEGITLALNSNLNLKALKGGQGLQELFNLPAEVLFSISGFEI